MLLEIPIDVMCEIFELLGLRDKIRLQHTCKYFYTKFQLKNVPKDCVEHWVKNNVSRVFSLQDITINPGSTLSMKDLYKFDKLTSVNISVHRNIQNQTFTILPISLKSMEISFFETTGNIQLCHLTNLTSLSIRNSKYENLYFPSNLSSLKIDKLKLKDPLSLTNLSSLKIYDNDNLLYLNSLTKLNHLCVIGEDVICDQLINLTSLKLCTSESNIKYDMFNLRKITKLALMGNTKVINIESLINLRELKYQNYIKQITLHSFYNLTSLSIIACDFTADEDIRACKNLKKLVLKDTRNNINDLSFASLTSIEICGEVCENVIPYIKNVTTLTNLNLSCRRKIGYLGTLTNLEALTLYMRNGGENCISNDDIKDCSNLRTLIMSGCCDVSDISYFTKLNLLYIGLPKNDKHLRNKIPSNGLVSLTNLRSLIISNDPTCYDLTTLVDLEFLYMSGDVNVNCDITTFKNLKTIYYKQRLRMNYYKYLPQLEIQCFA